MASSSSHSARVAAAVAAALLFVASSAVPAAAQQQQRRSSSTSAPPEGWSRVERWQVALHDGSYLWELGLVGLRGDTLVARQADSLVRLPLARIDELRLLQPSVKTVGAGDGGRATFGGLSGADDEVYALVRYAPEERRRIVEQALAAHPPGRAAAATGGTQPAERP